MAAIARATRSALGFIVFHDLQNNIGGRFFEYGMDEGWLATYFESYAQLNPIPAVSSLRPVGDVHTLDMLFEKREWTSSAFYQGWIRPQKLGDMVGLMALRSDHRAGWLGLQRAADDPDYGETDLSLLNLLSPHICRSLRIADVLDLRTITSDALDRTLDGLAAGVFLLDRAGRVLHANVAARNLIAAGTALSVTGGRLTPNDRDAEASLRGVLAKDVDIRSAVPCSVALPDQRGPGLLATVLPLDQGHRRHILAPFAATHAVFVQEAGRAPGMPLEALAVLHKLTKAEQRFVAVILSGAQVKDACAMLGLLESTGRSHLKQIFAKTGTSRQSELMKLFMSSAPPVRG